MQRPSSVALFLVSADGASVVNFAITAAGSVIDRSIQYSPKQQQQQ